MVALFPRKFQFILDIRFGLLVYTAMLVTDFENYFMTIKIYSWVYKITEVFTNSAFKKLPLRRQNEKIVNQNFIVIFKSHWNPTMAGMAVGWSAICNQKVVGLIPCQGTFWVAGCVPSQNACEATDWYFSLTPMFLSFSLLSPLSKNKLKISYNGTIFCINLKIFMKCW